jgi:hypothetical protein
MSAQDDLAAAVTALGTETAEREGKAGAVRDALAAVSSAVDGLRSAVDSLDGAPSDVPADQPASVDPVTADVPNPNAYPPTPDA